MDDNVFLGPSAFGNFPLEEKDRRPCFVTRITDCTPPERYKCSMRGWPLWQRLGQIPIRDDALSQLRLREWQPVEKVAYFPLTELNAETLMNPVRPGCRALLLIHTDKLALGFGTSVSRNC